MKKYDNFIKVDKFKCLSDGVKWKLDIVEKTISEIDKYVDSISFRKSKIYDVRSLISFSKKLDSQLSFNINYLYDLVPFNWDVDFYKSEPGTYKSVNFVCENKQAVIMPATEDVT